MMTNEQLKDYLITYTKEILAFEKELLNFYNLKNTILFNELGSIPKTGTILCNGKNIKYHFHGNGCTFEYDTVKVQYSIYTDRENYIATTPFEFMVFINSMIRENDVDAINQYMSLAYLNILERNGLVSKIFKEFYVFEINLNRVR